MILFALHRIVQKIVSVLSGDNQQVAITYRVFVRYNEEVSTFVKPATFLNVTEDGLFHCFRDQIFLKPRFSMR